MSETTETTKFPLLGEGNYGEWAIQMEAELIRKELWEVMTIETSPPTDATEMEAAVWLEAEKAKRLMTKMVKARAEMVLRVSAGQLVHLVSRDPMECWATLTQVHRAYGFATRLAMRRCFHRAVC
ncbi:uncharacterized protein LAESUDRAFT_800234 [Laetiporus sulphureus 93-53]|uniref:DUF4219 domain-containing protein n=1 Tax=Laetiporus sulphureus 93-53 TaxID=1314785 RepID=A0A165G4D3_9APHY|nr:uncharacterized protein LAESUDRAFT_800234 [Laetiporus sulphureus 93-53]KZT09813.1 hypothetical protein LAESUDRAFT_800234 [Laetiporus sulphureus 93-53]